MKRAGDEVGQEEEDLWYLRRLDGGLFTLQTVDYILAWIAMEDDGVCMSFMVDFQTTHCLDRFVHIYNKCSLEETSH